MINATKLHRAEKRPQFRRSAAYHETGHAVAAVALGIRVDSVSLHADKSGGTLEWYSGARTTIRQGEKLYGDEGVIIFLAGAAAQKKHAPSSMRRFSAMGDYETAESLVFFRRKSRSGSTRSLSKTMGLALSRNQQAD
jgi:Peptidase M50B-like